MLLFQIFRGHGRPHSGGVVTIVTRRTDSPDVPESALPAGSDRPSRGAALAGSKPTPLPWLPVSPRAAGVGVWGATLTEARREGRRRVTARRFAGSPRRVALGRSQLRDDRAPVDPTPRHRRRPADQAADSSASPRSAAGSALRPRRSRVVGHRDSEGKLPSRGGPDPPEPVPPGRRPAPSGCGRRRLGRRGWRWEGEMSPVPVPVPGLRSRSPRSRPLRVGQHGTQHPGRVGPGAAPAGPHGPTGPTA
jgi:hypothetical protein